VTGAAAPGETVGDVMHAAVITCRPEATLLTLTGRDA